MFAQITETFARTMTCTVWFQQKKLLEFEIRIDHKKKLSVF